MKSPTQECDAQHGLTASLICNARVLQPFRQEGVYEVEVGGSSLGSTIRRTLAIAVTIATIVLLGPVQPSASAGTGLSQTLCQTNQQSQFTTPLSIVNGKPVSYGYRDANFAGPGVPLRDGDVIRIHASGSIKIDSWPWGPSYSPAGHPTETLRTFWGGITAPKYGLYGYLVATQTAFQIGTDSGCVIYRGPETWLWLAQNDDRTDDNSGRWDITVRHFNV